VLRKFIIGLFVLTLAGCADVLPEHPTDHGQQYINGDLTGVLNKVNTVESTTPRNYLGFSRQVNEVYDHSRTITRKYRSLYERVEQWAQDNGNPAELSQYGIQAAQMGGADHYGNVLFTSYYSPVIELRHTAEGKFRYPIYGKPDCSGSSCPTRTQIYNGALEGQGLILGYSSSLLDNFLLEVQGSGFVHFGDTNKMEYFAYAGANGKKYVSIGRVLINRGEVPQSKMNLAAIRHWADTHSHAEVVELLEQNPSFVFFKPTKNLDVIGAAGVPLLGHQAVAADRRYIPMGSVLLAEVPLLNAQGKWTGQHVLRLLLALDTGGAVKGNHLDLYQGMGAHAGEKAGQYRDFGRVWMLGLQGNATQDPWIQR
jgi:membrane-bound lytic murein transglycosylase A